MIVTSPSTHMIFLPSKTWLNVAAIRKVEMLVDIDATQITYLNGDAECFWGQDMHVILQELRTMTEEE